MMEAALSTQKLYGKYRGVVVSNDDPEKIGKLLVKVTGITGQTPIWAMPCLPFAGRQMGMYALPQTGAGVWVEFEGGDGRKPIWVGCYWTSAAEVPALALASLPASPNVVLQTTGQSYLTISDNPAIGIQLSSSTGSLITMNAQGVSIVAPLIQLTGLVNINNGALQILP